MQAARGAFNATHCSAGTPHQSGALMRRCMIAVLIAVAPLALRAQVADTAAFPPVPSVVPKLLLPPDPDDSGFAAWRRIPIPRHDKLPAAWTMRAGNWDVLLGTPRAMDAMDSSRKAQLQIGRAHR